MNKRIVVKNADGTVGIIIPAKGYAIEDVAKKDVPEGLSFRIVDVDALPVSRNWRDAWTDDKPTKLVDVDLGKAKEVHKNLMVQQAVLKTSHDAFGKQDFAKVAKEIEDLKPAVDAAKTLDELYNTFPASINTRKDKRGYKVHKDV